MPTWFWISLGVVAVIAGVGSWVWHVYIAPFTNLH